MSAATDNLVHLNAALASLKAVKIKEIPKEIRDDVKTVRDVLSDLVDILSEGEPEEDTET